MKRTYLLFLLVTFTINAKSQELLNASKSEIKKAMIARGGTLMNESEDVFLCMFPKPIVEKSDIYNIMFFVAHDKCYTYVLKYGTNKHLKEVIARFDDPKSGYKRLNKVKGIKWQNSKGDEVEILDIYRNGVKISAFSLDIHTKEADQHF
ncbi:MAG: hypothetical protein ACXVDP_16800 [Bacteroidia bacterium]